MIVIKVGYLDMNGIGLAASLIGSLAWPAAAVIILAIFRKPVSKLIGRATQYKGFGQEITFGDELADAESKAQQLSSLRSPYSMGRARYLEQRKDNQDRVSELKQWSTDEAKPKQTEVENLWKNLTMRN